MSPGREESLHIVNAQERILRILKPRMDQEVPQSSRTAVSLWRVLPSLDSPGKPHIRALNTGQACPLGTSLPLLPCLVDSQSWEQRVPRVVGSGGGGGGLKLLPPNPTPGAGYVAQKGTVGLNITWAGQLSRAGMEKLGTLSCPHPGWVSGASASGDLLSLSPDCGPV